MPCIVKPLPKPHLPLLFSVGVVGADNSQPLCGNHLLCLLTNDPQAFARSDPAPSYSSGRPILHISRSKKSACRHKARFSRASCWAGFLPFLKDYGRQVCDPTHCGQTHTHKYTKHTGMQATGNKHDSFVYAICMLPLSRTEQTTVIDLEW